MRSADIAARPEAAASLASLKERMLTWYQETCDVVPHQTDKR